MPLRIKYSWSIRSRFSLSMIEDLYYSASDSYFFAMYCVNALNNSTVLYTFFGSTLNSLLSYEGFLPIIYCFSIKYSFSYSFSFPLYYTFTHGSFTSAVLSIIVSLYWNHSVFISSSLEIVVFFF